METQTILEHLKKWNFWTQDKQTGTQRTQYLTQLKPFIKIPEIIALIGLRRSGKSTICYQILEQLITQGVPRQNTLFINLEDPAWGEHIAVNTLQEMFQAYLEIHAPQGVVYVVLDEVQHVSRWERFVLSIYDSKQPVKFFITGSNSQLLQSNISNLLSGRYISKQVFPLNFQEFLQFKKISFEKIASPYVFHALREYIQYGGFPRVVLEENKDIKNALLQDYYNSIVERDIILRNNVRHKTELKDILLYVMSHITSCVSTYNLEKGMGVSSQTISAYLEYMEQAFLISRVKQYDQNVKKQIYNPDKVYVADTGLAHIAGFQFSPNIGRYMENAVFQHFHSQNKDIYYWQNGKEVDFVIRNGLMLSELIQVTYRLHADAWERETSALSLAAQQYPDAKKALIYWEDDYPDKPAGDFGLVRVDKVLGG